MRKPLRFFMVMLLVGLGIVFQNKLAFADTMEYTVVANIPDNQINKNLSYFDLKMEPGTTQDISLTVKNTSNGTMKLMIEPNTAITNQNGVIDYGQRNHKKDKSLKYAFSEIISDEQLITLEAGESKDVSFTIEMPEEEFDGIILGGFYVYEVKTEKSEKSTAQLKNKYAYVLGVQLKETDQEVKPNLVLNEVESTLINYRTAVTANLQNTEATIINNLDVVAKITKEGQDEILHETTQTNLSMAPNSNFDFPISWDNQPLEAGEYHLYLTATDGDQTWEFDKVFKIESKDAVKLSEEAVGLEKDNNFLYFVVGAVTIMGIGILFILWVKKRGGGSENDEK